MAGGNSRVEWTSSLSSAPAEAFVVCEKSKGLQAWGSTREALLLAAELHVAAKQFPQAQALLVRALALDAGGSLHAQGRGLLGFPDGMMEQRRLEFRKWLEAEVQSGSLAADAASRMWDFPFGR